MPSQVTVFSVKIVFNYGVLAFLKKRRCMRGSSLSLLARNFLVPREARKGAENTLENVYRNTIQELSGNITSHNVQKEVVL
jgi:hypothetical protein